MSTQRPPPAPQVALSRLHEAFALMSIIPLLTCFYLITVIADRLGFFSVQLLEGWNGAYFVLALVIALVGLLIGRRIIQDVIQQLVEANAKSARLLEELARVNEQLQRELVEHERSETRLKEANTALKQSHDELVSTQMQLIDAVRMKSVGRLAAGVAHEVKNPLAIILIGINYLSTYLNSRDEKVTTALQDMNDAVKRADAVIRGLLDFSASKELAVKPEPLNEIIEESFGLVKHELTKSNVTVVKELAGDLPPLALDRQKIEQVFVNLFMNAIHAMPKGGTLTVRTALRSLTTAGVHVGYRSTDRFRVGQTVVVAEVEDTGTGIPEETLAKVFEPFFTTKPAGQGTGLGLAVTHHIIDLHQGTIHVKNRDGHGLRVTMMLGSRV